MSNRYQCSELDCDRDAEWRWWNGMGVVGRYCDDHAREQLNDEHRCPITRAEDVSDGYVLPAGIQPVRRSFPTIRTKRAFDTYLETDGDGPRQCTVAWCSGLASECIHSDGQELATDGGTSRGLQCDYCDTTDLVYRLESDRGTVNRCIPCLAIEQGQQKYQMPFEVWIDRDDIEPPDQEKFPDAPDFDPFDPREHDYKTALAWFTILARVRSDKPILKRDPEAIGTIFEDTREFLINFMGADAHKRPSELTQASDGGNVQSRDTASSQEADR